jgi:hypothetical protein
VPAEPIKPKAVIPMHGGTKPLAQGTAEEFGEARGASAVRVVDVAPAQVLAF